MKIFGFIPARMASSRFPGKPLYPICGMPMAEHVVHRARMYKKWDGLFLTTCDKEIQQFGESIDIPTIMTSDLHTRALDRIAEAVIKCGVPIDDNDIVLNVQADEPMLHPEMIDATIQPMIDNPVVMGTILAMDIVEEEQFLDPNILKIIHKKNGDILYTSRSPIPYCKEFSPELGAKRIYGIFGFRWHFLKTFTSLEESPLELVESCDSNRLYDNGFTQRIAPYPYLKSFAVDAPEDIIKVEMNIKNDPYYESYRK
ncbi:MAG: 3-deoxy-manno-octulosonate cytidylyltransferase [Bacteroidales bacterium]|nr:3-deoxy-manno-octulosonate cytidylyltransferase [Bacteroidales bacterium]